MDPTCVAILAASGLAMKFRKAAAASGCFVFAAMEKLLAAANVTTGSPP